MNYHLVIVDGFITAVSVDPVKNATNSLFSKEFLDRFGIHVPEDRKYMEVSHPFVRFIYDPAAEVIITEPKPAAEEAAVKRVKRNACLSNIVNGFSVQFGGDTRFYDCDIEDQLAIMQAPMLAMLSENKFADIKCTVNNASKKQFVAHNPDECNKVYAAMARHILQHRKELAEG